MLDTGFAPCYTGYNMVEFTSDELDCNVGDIVVETLVGEKDPPAYWVITKVIDNDNPIRYGTLYKKLYYVFNLENELNTHGPITFRPSTGIHYEVIRG